METKEKLEKIKQGIAEIITEKELEEVLSKSNPRVYVGYEPSGKIHLGHALSVNKLVQMQSLGFNVVVLLADLHAYLNGKGSLEQIKKIAEYNKQCFIALGLDQEQTEFVLGSEIQLKGDYFLDVQRLALQTTLLRAKRSMDLVGRREENPKVARVIYPLMQVIDMVALRVDVALGGMDQRKIHMLARDNLPKLGYSSPVCMHLPIIHGLDGDEKMSSSKENFIAIDDAPEVIRKKMKKAYCPIGSKERNPVLEIYKYFIFNEYKEVEIKRPEKFGGNISFKSYEELENAYLREEIHPQDLKTSASEYLIDMLSDVREYMKQKEG